MGHSPSRRHRQGFTFVEILVAMILLLVGMVALMKVFPPTLRANSDSAMRHKAILFAQRKAEEIRRDDDRQESMQKTIAALNTPTAPLVVPEDRRLVYQFSGRSILDPVPTVGDPLSRDNVARIIVRYNEDFRPDGKILYELRFYDLTPIP